MKPENKLLSFCILTYRNFDGIFDTLDSLFQQDYSCIELIISDDGSPNYEEHIGEIQKYVERHKSNNIVKIRYNQMGANVGTVKHCNAVLRIAEGEYIKELGADDVLNCTDALSKYVSFLENNDYEICFAKMCGVRPNGERIYHLAACEDDYELLRSLSPEQTLNRLFARNFLPAPAWCAKRSLFTKHGFYSEKTKLIEDYPYWIHLCMQGVRFGYMDDRMIDYRLNGVSSAGSYSEKFMDDMVVIYENYIFPNDKRYGIFQSIYNELKRMGLNAYYAKARWNGYSVGQKIGAYIKYGIFFIYIELGNYKYRKLNEKH